MQTRITENLDFGIPGEFASTNPRYVDMPYFVNTAIDYGKVAAVSGNKVAPVGTSDYTAVKGIVVSTHQGVNRGGANGALAATLTAPVGQEVAIVRMGDVYVLDEVSVTADAISGKDTEAEAVAAAKAALDVAVKAAMPKRNDSVYYKTADGTIQASSSNATALGRVRDAADVVDSMTYTVTAAQDASTQKWGVASPAAAAKVVIALTIA